MRAKDIYDRGFKDGLTCFAHWMDGTTYVGTCGSTLSDAIEGMEKLHNYAPPQNVDEEMLELIEEVISEDWILSTGNGPDMVLALIEVVRKARGEG